MRHSLETIERVKVLRRQGFTLTEIIAETGLPKTTIFHHIQNIATSEEFKAKLIAATHAKMMQWAANRRGKSFKTYPHWEPTEWSPHFVNLVAHFMFDGELNKTAVIYNNRSQALIDNVVSLMDELIGTSDYRRYLGKDDVIKVGWFHVEIADFLRGKATELLKYISTASDDEKIAFLKAFFDDEGNVSFVLEKRRRIVRGYQHSIPILELVQKLLADFGIFSRVQPKFYEICISRKADIIRFAEIINFSDGLCVNGLRSNSVWKESLEKKEILNRLIHSYQPEKW